MPYFFFLPRSHLDPDISFHPGSHLYSCNYSLNFGFHFIEDAFQDQWNKLSRISHVLVPLTIPIAAESRGLPLTWCPAQLFSYSSLDPHGISERGSCHHLHPTDEDRVAQKGEVTQPGSPGARALPAAARG